MKKKSLHTFFYTLPSNSLLSVTPSVHKESYREGDQTFSNKRFLNKFLQRKSSKECHIEQSVLKSFGVRVRYILSS